MLLVLFFVFYFFYLYLLKFQDDEVGCIVLSLAPSGTMVGYM